ncbi:NAD-dependent epimerase/dehydratase family protein [Sulfurimonas sp.]
MKILLSGVTGFIGQNLVKELIANGYEVHAIVRKSSNCKLIHPDVILYEYNGEIENLISYAQKQHFNGIIHLASLFLATHLPKDISMLINSNITLGVELLEVAKSSNIKWFINTGTFWQHYESQKYNPVNLYAATKEAFESMAKYYVETSGLIFTTIKLNDTFGPNDTRNKVFNLWNKIAKTEELLKMSAGEQIIDISYIDDVVQAYLLLCKHLSGKNAQAFQNKSFIVTQERKMPLKELASLFEKATKSKLNIEWGAREYREREVMNPWKNGNVVPEWKQKFSLEEAIQKTVGRKND